MSGFSATVVEDALSNGWHRWATMDHGAVIHLRHVANPSAGPQFRSEQDPGQTKVALSMDHSPAIA